MKVDALLSLAALVAVVQSTFIGGQCNSWTQLKRKSWYVLTLHSLDYPLANWSKALALSS